MYPLDQYSLRYSMRENSGCTCTVVGAITFHGEWTRVLWNGGLWCCATLSMGNKVLLVWVYDADTGAYRVVVFC